MPGGLIWLADVLVAAGLKVAEDGDAWKTRGVGEMGQPLGVMCHHTGGPAEGNMPTYRTLVEGRPDLKGPLAQLGLGRDGTFYVIAAGRANHAGAGLWRGVSAGNSHFIAVEAENTGRPDDPWPAVQMDAYARGIAAILTHIGAGSEMCCGHKEYAAPKGRKCDPSFDMDSLRTRVAALMAGAPVPPPIPRSDGRRPTMRRGGTGPLVATLQRALAVEPADGDFGGRTEAAVRAFQRRSGLVPDGIVGPATWAAIDKACPPPDEQKGEHAEQPLGGAPPIG